MQITKELAQKVLETVDAGLCCGLGEPVPGQMCVEAAVCYAMGLPHSDEPTCVAPSLRAFKILLNDSAWSSNEARAKGMRRLAIAQLGSAGGLDETLFAQEIAKLAKIWSEAYAARAAAADAARAAAADAARAAAADAARAAASAAAADAARAAAYAARAAAPAYADAAARDKVLSKMAEDVVQLLIRLSAPGCQFLYLTDGSAE